MRCFYLEQDIDNLRSEIFAGIPNASLLSGTFLRITEFAPNRQLLPTQTFSINVQPAPANDRRPNLVPPKSRDPGPSQTSKSIVLQQCK